MPGKVVATPASSEGISVEVTLAIEPRVRRRTVRPSTTSVASPRIPRVTRLMALAIKFEGMIDRGEVQDFADIARLGYVTRARITQVMNLLLLAPDIQEELLALDDMMAQWSKLRGRHLRAVTRRVLWVDQRRAWNDLRARMTNATQR